MSRMAPVNLSDLLLLLMVVLVVALDGILCLLRLFRFQILLLRPLVLRGMDRRFLLLVVGWGTLASASALSIEEEEEEEDWS